MRHAFLFSISIFLMMATPAFSGPVSYRDIAFVGEQHGSGDQNTTWTQLDFVVNNIKLSGTCYSGCILRFSLDRNLYSEARADIGIKKGSTETVTSNFPAFDNVSNPPYAFVGSGTVGVGTELRRSIQNFSKDEKLILAWIAARAPEFINLAASSGKLPPQTSNDWIARRESFGRSVRRSLSFLNAELNAVEKNTPLTTFAVWSMQADLAGLGLYAWEIDGVPGTRTRRAITQFQNDKGRLATGHLDSVEQEILARTANRSGVGSTRTTSAAPDSELLVQLRQDISDRNAKISELNRQAQFRAAEQNTMRAKISDLEGRLGAAVRTIAEWGPEPKNTTAEIGDRIADLERQLAAANATIADDRDAIESTRAELSALPELEATKAALDGSVLELERQLSAANATIANERDNLEKSRQELAALSEVNSKNTELNRQLSAANTTIANLQDGAARDEKVVELERKLAATNATIADNFASITAANEELAAIPGLENANTALKVSLEEQQRQLSAANQSVANLRSDIEKSFTPNSEMTEVERQLAAANRTLADLRSSIVADYVEKSEHNDVKSQLEALNRTNADLQQKIVSEYVPRNEHLLTTNQLQRQLAALNQSILEVQERNESQKRRLIEAESLFTNFREDCRTSPACAKEMQLE